MEKRWGAGRNRDEQQLGCGRERSRDGARMGMEQERRDRDARGMGTEQRRVEKGWGWSRKGAGMGMETKQGWGWNREDGHRRNGDGKSTGMEQRME